MECSNHKYTCEFPDMTCQNVICATSPELASGKYDTLYAEFTMRVIIVQVLIVLKWFLRADASDAEWL